MAASRRKKVKWKGSVQDKRVYTSYRRETKKFIPAKQQGPEPVSDAISD